MLVCQRIARSRLALVISLLFLLGACDSSSPDDGVGSVVQLTEGGYEARFSAEGSTVLYLDRIADEDVLYGITLDGGATPRELLRAEFIEKAVTGPGDVLAVGTEMNTSEGVEEPLFFGDVASGNLEAVTEGVPHVFASPTDLYFTRYERLVVSAVGPRLYRLNTVTGATTLLLDNYVAYPIAMTAEGLLFTGTNFGTDPEQDGFFVLADGDSAPRLLFATSGAAGVGFGSRTPVEAKLSPDGCCLLTARPDPATGTDGEFDDLGFVQIFELHLDGSGATRLTDAPADHVAAGYLGDGRIVFEIREAAERFVPYVAGRDGGVPHVLASDLRGVRVSDLSDREGRVVLVGGEDTPGVYLVEVE